MSFTISTSFKSRVEFWLKRSPQEATPGELVELANLLTELSEAIRHHSVLSIISELPQLTKFLYRIVTDPNFRIILVTKRVSLSFCRCLRIFLRSSLEEVPEEAVSEPRRQEISSKSRDWALMVLRLALSPRWLDHSTSQGVVQPKLAVASSAPNSYVAGSQLVLVQKQMRKDLIDCIDYHAFHITKKQSFAERCSVLSCPYNVETHWKRLKDIGVFILSIIQSNGEGEDHWCFPIIYHWLLSCSHLHSPHSCGEFGSILQLQTRGFSWELNKGYTSRTISLRIPQPWTTLPIPIAYRLLLENDDLRKEYCDWLESLLLKHLLLCNMVLLDNDVLSNEHRFLLLEIIKEPIVVCWMRGIWFEKIEQCSDKWKQRILISFWNEIIQRCHPSVTYSMEDIFQTFYLQQKDRGISSSHVGEMNIGMEFPFVKMISFSTRDEEMFVRRYFWESIRSLESQFVMVCLKMTFHWLSEEEFCSYVAVICQWWCLPCLSYSSRCWNTHSYHLFRYIWHHYVSWIRVIDSSDPSCCPTDDETTLPYHKNHYETSSPIYMQMIFVDILFHTLSYLHMDHFNFQLLDHLDGSILLYMEIMEVILDYCTHHSTTLTDTRYQKLFHLYQQMGKEYSTSSNPQKRRYQLFCQHILNMNHSSSKMGENDVKHLLL